MEDALSYIFEEDNVLDDFEGIEVILRAPRIYQIRRNYFEEYDERAFGTRFRLYKRLSSIFTDYSKENKT